MGEEGGDRERRVQVGSASHRSPPTLPAVLAPTRLAKPHVHPTCFPGDDILGLFTEAG